MSDASESTRGLERLKEAAERARRDLQQQLASEADRLDRDLGRHSQQLVEGVRLLAEDRVEREVDRLQRASSDLSLELNRQLHEAAERYRELLSRQLEANATALRAEVDGMLREARRELEGVHDELTRLGGEIRAAVTRAEDGVIETARVAEATVRARAQSAAAEAVRDLTSTAAGLTQRLEQSSRPADSRERLDEVLDRIQAADQRLRDSDARTRRALEHLRVFE